MYPKLIGKRNEMGYTQEKMAKELGISKNNYYLKENGKLDFNLSEVKKILKILNASYEEIFLTNT
jgi:putative transcriptional regulator